LKYCADIDGLQTLAVVPLFFSTLDLNFLVGDV